MPYKVIQVGTGGFGGTWCRRFLPPNIQDGIIEVVAAADLNAESLENAREFLGLRNDQCYTDVKKAFDENAADFCVIVVPPAFHEHIVDMALAHDMHILSEKPIADTLAASIRIADKVRRTGKKMGVTMSHRFDQDKSTLREQLRSGRHGRLDYLIGHHTCDFRKAPVWGKFRYEIPDVQLVEGCVHHLDIMADLAGAQCDLLYAQTWNPPWGDFAGDPQALVTMHFENGARGVLEAGAANAVGLYPWGHEYWRAECELATLVLDHRSLECFAYDASQRTTVAKSGEGRKIPLLEQPTWANTWLIAKFVHWLDGGGPMETNVEDNLQSVAMVFAAIESSRTGQPVKVQDFLGKSCSEIGKPISTPSYATDRAQSRPVVGKIKSVSRKT
jgi:predicted dehydrogenase